MTPKTLSGMAALKAASKTLFAAMLLAFAVVFQLQLLGTSADELGQQLQAFGAGAVSVGSMKTFNSSDAEKSVFGHAENVTIRVNVTDADGATDLGHVYGNISFPDGSIAQRTFYTPINNQTANGYEFQYAGPSDGLVLALSFEEGIGDSTNDWSNLTNNGTLVNFTCTTLDCNATNGWTANGSLGRGAMFNRGSGFVNITDAASLNPPDQITIAAWIYPKSVEATHQTIVEKAYTSHVDPFYQYLLIFRSGTNIRFDLSVAGTRQSASGNTTLATNTWYHVAATYNGTEMSVYVNGKLDGNLSGLSGGIPAYATDVVIGRHRNIDTEKFNGTIDEVRIWNRSLSPAEIRQVMNQTFSIADFGSVAGNWSADANASDKSNNSAANFTAFSVGSAPTIAYAEPTTPDGANRSENWIFINATFSDPDNDVQRISYYLYNATGLVNGTTFNSPGSPSSLNFSGLADGNYTINATVFDSANRSASLLSRSIAIDAVPPGIDFVASTPAGA
ncbi:MAG: LamG domain-containing protein, partial [Candidatus Aenigmarchaeota archaeon]|nr:LamG domain-containing protein [Candidatus Aenigmarchaeota archaeon]